MVGGNTIETIYDEGYDEKKYQISNKGIEFLIPILFSAYEKQKQKEKMLNDYLAVKENKATTYDMATRDDYGNSVMVCYENTMLTALREITIDEYEQNVKVNLESITEIDYEFQSSEDISLGDTSFRRIIFSATVNDVEMTQAYYAKVMGKYVITFIVTAVTEDVKAIEAMFTK